MCISCITDFLKKDRKISFYRTENYDIARIVARVSVFRAI